MNILHMKYAVEVARAGSISKASEALYMAQSNLSRSIKELEADLGITIFRRSPRGMTLTPQGEEFIRYARKVLGQIDAIERKYKDTAPARQRFSVAVPRASYISYAFTRFTRHIGAEPAEYFYLETDSSAVIDNVLSADYDLGVIRYAADQEDYFRETLEEKGLVCETVAEFRYVLIMSRENPIAQKTEVFLNDLRPLIEIAHGDPHVPSLPLAAARRAEQSEEGERRIFLFDRGSQFDLLMENPETFMWASPLPRRLISRYDLMQRECTDSRRVYRDALICRRGYALTELDRRFIAELHNAKRKCF